MVERLWQDCGELPLITDVGTYDFWMSIGRWLVYYSGYTKVVSQYLCFFFCTAALTTIQGCWLICHPFMLTMHRCKNVLEHIKVLIVWSKFPWWLYKSNLKGEEWESTQQQTRLFHLWCTLLYQHGYMWCKGMKLKTLYFHIVHTMHISWYSFWIHNC